LMPQLMLLWQSDKIAAKAEVTVRGGREGEGSHKGFVRSGARAVTCITCVVS
jgi:hypothetical protein